MRAWHPIQGLFPPHTQCFCNRLQRHHRPDQDKVITQAQIPVAMAKTLRLSHSWAVKQENDPKHTSTPSQKYLHELSITCIETAISVFRFRPWWKPVIRVKEAVHMHKSKNIKERSLKCSAERSVPRLQVSSTFLWITQTHTHKKFCCYSLQGRNYKILIRSMLII